MDIGLKDVGGADVRLTIVLTGSYKANSFDLNAYI